MIEPATIEKQMTTKRRRVRGLLAVSTEATADIGGLRIHTIEEGSVVHFIVDKVLKEQKTLVETLGALQEYDYQLDEGLHVVSHPIVTLRIQLPSLWSTV